MAGLAKWMDYAYFLLGISVGVSQEAWIVPDLYC